MPFELFTDADAEMWVLFGTDSGFEGATTIYFVSGKIVATRLVSEPTIQTAYFLAKCRHYFFADHFNRVIRLVVEAQHDIRQARGFKFLDAFYLVINIGQAGSGGTLVNQPIQ
jgi:hypothetical protein